MQSARYLCQVLMKFQFPVTYLRYTNISNFMKICPVGCRDFSCERKDRQD